MNHKRIHAAVCDAMARLYGAVIWRSMPARMQKALIESNIRIGSVTLPEGQSRKYLRGLREKDMSVKKKRMKGNMPGAGLSGRAKGIVSAAKVKDAGDRLSTKRYALKRPNGGPVLFGSKPLETPSEYDKALIGAYFKSALRRLGVRTELTDWEKSLLAESATKDRWVGTTPNGSYYGGGAPDDYAPATAVKALLDDTISGGLYLNPVVLDLSIISFPLLSGQLFPYVDVVPVTGRRVMTPTIQNMTLTWGQSAGTAVAPINTAALVNTLDTAVFPVAGFLELSNELQMDSPVDVGATVIGLFGEKLKAELDRVIAIGNGYSEPLGIANSSGLIALHSDMGTSGPPTVSDAEAMIFGVPLQYRQLDLNPAFLGNDTLYRRFRGIAVGPADERRVFGMDEQSYQLLEYPFRVQNDLPNNMALFGCLKKFRLYQRLGMEIIRETGGRTLALSNTQLVGLRARFGGRPVDGNAFSLVVDFQA